MAFFCPLCKGLDVRSLFCFPSTENELVEIFLCSSCGSLFPNFELKEGEDFMAQQLHLHEGWWADSTVDDLAQNLRGMSTTVSQLRAVLTASNNSGGGVIEIGSGRGGMLRALIDQGYSAIGCEPSSKLVKLAQKNYNLPKNILYNLNAQEFLDGPVSQLPHPPSAAILWHVLEHISDPLVLVSRLHDVLVPNGLLVLQLPLLHQPAVFRGHHFFISEASLDYLARKCGFQVISLDYDLDNFYLTACLSKTASVSGALVAPSVFNNHTNPVTDAILLRDRSIAEKRALLDERWSAMQSMEAMIRDRDEAISAQARMLDERWSAMQSMESMIRERDEAIAARSSLLYYLHKLRGKFSNW